MKYTLLIAFLLMCMFGCTEYFKKEARGLKGSIDNAMYAVACVAIGQLPCVSIVVVKGYSEGVEVYNDKKTLEKVIDKKIIQEKKGWFK